MIDMEQQEYRINFCCVVIFRICLYFVYTHTHTYMHNTTLRGIQRNTHTYVMCIYLFCILVNHFRLFMLHFAHAHVYARTLTHTHARNYNYYKQSRICDSVCTRTYVCKYVQLYVERGPLFVYFYFGIDFKIKRRTFLDASVIQIPIPIFSSFSSLSVVLFAGFLFAPQLHNICSAHFVYTILFIYFTASSEFYFAPRARTDTHSIPHSHTHTCTLTHSLTRQNSRLHVCMCRFVCRRIYVHVRRRRHTHL